MARLWRRWSSASAGTDEVFDKLLKNTIARFTNDRSAVYKELLDLHDDHFKLESHKVDLAVARLGDDQRTLLEVDPYVFAMRIVAGGHRRASVVYDPLTKKAVASHGLLEPLATLLNTGPSAYDEHEGLFFEVGRRSRALLGGFLWRTERGQALGGVRMAKYTTLADFVRDGLQASVSMGRKTALAGVWAGGGGGIIARPGGHDVLDDGFRRDLFQDYGEFLTSLRGCLIAAEDTGTSVRDMDLIYSRTRFTSCISEALGGSGHPAVATAQGVVSAIEGALTHKGMGSLQGKEVVVQGVGTVGLALIRQLLARNVGRLVAADTNKEAVDHAARLLEGQPLELRLVPAEDMSILAERCDVLAPNAVGAVLNPTTIPTIRAKVLAALATAFGPAGQIVCGGTSSPLEDTDRDSQLLHAAGITYVPDFVAHRMAAVSSAMEPLGWLENDPLVQRHFLPDWGGSVYATTVRVLEMAKALGVTPTQAANRIADELSRVPHPLYPGRAKAVVASLVARKWHARDENDL